MFSGFAVTVVKHFLVFLTSLCQHYLSFQSPSMADLSEWPSRIPVSFHSYPSFHPPSQIHFLPSVKLTSKTKWMSSPSIQNDQICSVGQKGLGAQSLTRICRGEVEQSGPLWPHVYLWMTEPWCKALEQCCYTEGLIFRWAGRWRWWWWRWWSRWWWWGERFIPHCWGLVQSVVRGLGGVTLCM